MAQQEAIVGQIYAQLKNGDFDLKNGNNFATQAEAIQWLKDNPGEDTLFITLTTIDFDESVI